MPFVGATSLLARPSENGVTGNFFYGLAEYEDMAFLMHLLTGDDVFVDVGANVGAFTVLASGVCGAKSIAFEPVDSAADRLEANLNINRLNGSVLVHRLAVGAQKGMVRFTTDEDTMNHVALGDEAGKEVPVETLDSALEGVDPILIKIDVEGYEPDVLAGARDCLRRRSLLAIIVEINGALERYGRSIFDLFDPLSEMGFAPFAYNPISRQLTRLKGANQSSGNTIFVKDPAAVMERIKCAPLRTIGTIQL